MTGLTHRIAGVMGGMGPDATVDFMAKVIALTSAECDQDHAHMIVDHDPRIPDRQQAINTGTDDVSERLGEMARRLETAGADFLVLVCNTAHVFLEEVRATTTIPFINIIDVSVDEVDRLCPGASRIGVMATTGCLETGIYQDAVTRSGKRAIIPDVDNIKRLMDLINAIKAGEQDADVRQGMEAVAETLVHNGAEVLIAGCTEIPLVFSGNKFSLPVIASTDVLARRTMEIATGLVAMPERATLENSE